LLFCDTDLITTQIYSAYYFNHVPEIVKKLQQQERYDFYLLLNIDTPWMEDSQRDCGHLRELFHAWFRYELFSRSLPFEEIDGSWEERFKTSVLAVEGLMRQPMYGEQSRE
jgi:nicotinamide riboside kinase